MAFTLRIYDPNHPPYWAEKKPVAGTARSIPTQLFPADNWWYKDISAAPLDDETTRYMSGTPASYPVDPNDYNYRGMAVGPNLTVSPRYDWGNNYGFPLCTVSRDYPTVTFTHISYSGGTSGDDTRGYPVPIQSLTEPGWTEDLTGTVDNPVSVGDRHLLIYDVDNRHLYEIYQPYHNATGAPVSYREFTVLPGEYACASCSFWDCATNDVRPIDATSSDAAGLQVIPGLLTYDEAMSADPITHAFRTYVANASYQQPHFVWPATHEAGNYLRDMPPLGARLRLKASFDLSVFDPHYPHVKKVATALKKYGAIVADNGGHGMISGTTDDRWGDYDSAIRAEFADGMALMDWDDFEVVQLGWGEPILSGAPYQLATFGDSKTVDGTATGGWALQLDTALEQVTGQAWPTSTYAAGSTTLAWARTNIAGLLAQVPDTTNLAVVCVLNWGVNEMASMPSSATWIADYQYIIDQIVAKQPRAKCVLTKPWYRGKDSEAATMATWVETIVTSRPLSAYVGHNEGVWLKGADDGASMTTDGVHYSAAGHAMCKTQLLTILRP